MLRLNSRININTPFKNLPGDVKENFINLCFAGPNFCERSTVHIIIDSDTYTKIFVCSITSPGLLTGPYSPTFYRETNILFIPWNKLIGSEIKQNWILICKLLSLFLFFWTKHNLIFSATYIRSFNFFSDNVHFIQITLQSEKVHTTWSYSCLFHCSITAR